MPDWIKLMAALLCLQAVTIVSWESLRPKAAQAGPELGRRYDYKLYRAAYFDEMEPTLKRLGAEGWLVVSEYAGNYTLVRIK